MTCHKIYKARLAVYWWFRDGIVLTLSMRVLYVELFLLPSSFAWAGILLVLVTSCIEI
jgi:hypothetical protein